MRRICLALVAVLLAASASAGVAAADTPPSGVPQAQTAGQVAANDQYAGSSATSTQIAPQNTNVTVRVLSPGTNGSVSQTNSSTAGALAANGNLTSQQIGQAGGALQTGEQLAASRQDALAVADSTQVKPENTNIDVRVLSPGHTGPVTQTNASSAGAVAANLNATGQELTQASDGPAAIQSAGQVALSEQDATAQAESKQIAPKNTNVDVRVLSPGHGGGVTQANTSDATAISLNANHTAQAIEQSLSRPVRCCGDGYSADDGVAVQAAGQIAGNVQSATVCCAESLQIHPENTNVSLGEPTGDTRQSNTSNALGVAANLNGLDQSIEQGPAHDDLKPAAAPVARQDGLEQVLPDARVAPTAGTSQSNASNATSLAVNLNKTTQTIEQSRESAGGVDIQAAGQAAANKQDASADAVSTQVGPQNRNGGVAGPPDHGCKEWCAPDPCARDRCKPDPCASDRCKPDPCVSDRCKPDPCVSDRCKPDRCARPRCTLERCEPKLRRCGWACHRRIPPPQREYPTEDGVMPLAA